MTAPAKPQPAPARVREEPEQGDEADIPSDDGTEPEDVEIDREIRPLRDVERE
jgi:hypothetical protein